MPILRAVIARNMARTVKLPWAEPGSRFTALFEALAINWLRAASEQAVADRLSLSWDEVARHPGEGGDARVGAAQGRTSQAAGHR